MNVLELFAGVGGFRIGLENSSADFYKTKWANQWEPSKKSQDAFEVYNYNYPNSYNINKSISEISNEEFASMDADLIVGGFPCQDYSVARSKNKEMGIEGKKGVLFWEIIRAVNQIKPKYLILENVDRLLKSPSKQRGRDFAIMLSAFNNLDYSVEWRVINAAEYGRSQRRRRVFFFVYRNDTGWGKYIDSQFETKNSVNEHTYDQYIFKDGLFAQQFKIKSEPYKKRHSFGRLDSDVVKVSDFFTGNIWNTGIMRYGNYTTIDTESSGEENPIALKDILINEKYISESYYVTDEKLKKFEYLRGPKKIERISASGHKYIFSEGGMSPHDDLTLPGRTMLTSEGSINRSTHLLYINNRYRLLTPIEAERLQDFPDDWTKYKRTSDNQKIEVTDRMRLFFMGNALVTVIVERIANQLKDIDSLYL